MSRDLDSPLAAALDEPVIRPFYIIRIELPDPVYVWTGSGTLIFDDVDGNSRDWIGAGEVGAIDTVGESTDGSATGITVTLLNIPSQFQMADGTWMSDYLAQQAVRGVVFDFGFGVLNESYQTIEGVVWLNRYRLDKYQITDGGQTLSVQVAGESRAIDQRRPSIKRFTDEWQQRKSPGDVFFQFLSQMTEIQILWDKAELGTAQVGGGGGSGAGGLSGGGFSLRDNVF